MKDEVDASSPVGILEDYFRTSESETSSTKSICSDFDAQQNSKPASRWRTFSESLRTRSMKHLSQLHPASVLKLTRRGSRTLRENASMQMDSVGDNSVKSHWKNFTLSEIQNATNNFNPGNLIGKGGYAEVYRGCLKTGNLVAIKRLIRGSVEERSCDFLSELGIMAHVDHPNTAKLIGYGVEGGMHLVLELSPHGSLASWLQGSTNKLQWSIRYKIALGTAEGLVYLHEGCKRRIVHRDIKAANILLTKDFEPQICDFGLAKWLPEQWTHHTVSKFEGTFGYLAPEYLMHGIVDEKTDVFAFGVLLLELITGRRALNHSLQSLVMWAKPLIRKNKVRELVDPSLSCGYDSHQMNLMVLAASLCVKQSSLKRPRMSQVLQVLKGSLSCLDGTGLRRGAFYRRAFVKETLSLNTKEYDSGDELNDINQLKQLAFG